MTVCEVFGVFCGFPVVSQALLVFIVVSAVSISYAGKFVRIPYYFLLKLDGPVKRFSVSLLFKLALLGLLLL